MVGEVLTGVGALGQRRTRRGASFVLRGDEEPRFREEQVSAKTPTRPRQIVYGQTRAEGTVVFAHQTTEQIPLTPTATLIARVLHQVVVFADHRVKAFDEVWFDNEIIPLNADGSVKTGNKLANWAWVNKHLGDDGQAADTDLIAAAGDKWASTDKLSGVAYLYVRLVLLESKFPNRRPPNITAVISGKDDVFNPKTHATGYTANAALCLRDYLYNRRFGMKLRALYGAGTVTVTNGSPTVTGSGTLFLANVLPGDQFDVSGDGTWARVQTVDSDTQLTLAANYVGGSGGGKAYKASSEMDEAGAVVAQDICDENVTLAAGGTEKRYEANGQLTQADRAGAIVEAFRTALAGDLIQSGGKWLIKAGAYEAPTVTLDDDDLFAPADVVLRRRRTQVFNRVRGTFRSPDHRWQKTDLPAFSEASFVTEDDGEDIDTSVNFRLTTSFAACQRIMKIMLRRARQQEQVTLLAKTKALRLRAGDPVGVTNATVPWTTKPFRIERLTARLRSADEGVGMELRCVATASSVYAWAAEETALAALPTVLLPVPFTPIDRPGEDKDANNVFDLRVSGLELDNAARGNSTEFTGSSAKFVWRDNALVEVFELGAEPGGAGSGALDPNFRDYFVTIKDTDGTERRSESTIFPGYDYTIAKNRADGDGTPVREFIIEVVTRTADGQQTRIPAKMQVKNPAPALPNSFSFEGQDRKVILTKMILARGREDADQTGMAIWTSTSSGFTPDDTTLSYQGGIATIEISAPADTEIFIRLAIVDAFGLTGLNIAAEVSVKTSQQQTLTPGVITWDLDTFPWGVVTLNQNSSIDVINLRQGTFFLTVIQDGTGGRALTYNATRFQFPSAGTQPDHASAAANQKDIVTFLCDGAVMQGVGQLDFKAAA